MNQNNSKQKSLAGWAASIVIHLCICALFLNVYYESNIPETDVTEVTFTSYSPEDIPKASPARTQTAMAPERRNTNVSNRSRVVDLAKRKMLEDELPTLPTDVKDKVMLQENEKRTGIKVDPLTGLSKESKIKPGVVSPGEREVKGAQSIDVGQKISSRLASEGNVANAKIKKPYEISWDSGEREVLNDPLPEFPEGVTKDVVLKIRLTVLPDGTLGSTLPLQKGDATLETVTLQALKKWRFNPLEKSAPQVNQSGVIVFRFVLK
jgi:hypothetical protein